MTQGVILLVALGLIATTAAGIAVGLDTTLVIILAFIALFGLLAVAVARKARAGGVSPALCAACGGVMSPNAPYCKHCGTRVGGA